MQRARIAGERDAAERGEARRVGARQRERIGDAGRALHVERVAKHRIERRLERARRLGIEHPDRNAELLGERALARGRREARVAAVELEPAGLAHEVRGAGLRHQLLVLGDRAAKQRTHRAGGLGEPLGLRGGAVRQQPRRDLRQEAEMVVRIGRALERDLGEPREPAGKRRRKHRVALDDAGVAVRGLLARPAAVDQRDREPAPREVQRGRDADDAGAEDDRIGARHERCSGACPMTVSPIYGSRGAKSVSRTGGMTAMPPSSCRGFADALVRPTGRCARLARPPGHARGRAVAVRRPRAAVARGGDEAGLHAERVRAALPRVPARRAGRPAAPVRPPRRRARRRGLDDGGDAARLRPAAGGARARSRPPGRADVPGRGAAGGRLVGARRADGSRCGARARRSGRLRGRDAGDRGRVRRAVSRRRHRRLADRARHPAVRHAGRRGRARDADPLRRRPAVGRAPERAHRRAERDRAVRVSRSP